MSRSSSSAFAAFAFGGNGDEAEALPWSSAVALLSLEGSLEGERLLAVGPLLSLLLSRSLLSSAEGRRLSAACSCEGWLPLS